MTKKTYIALGANVGDRLDSLHQALLMLDENPEIHVNRLSSIYETDPVGYTDQPNFLNMVAEVSTTLSPLDFFHITSTVETQLGRERTVRWGPRVIDLDILLYDNLRMETDLLQIPHPRMVERAFVLIPLAEINPELRIPDQQSTIADYISQISDKEGVRLWRQNNGEEKYALFES
ncbi:MAG TPA: 2-amino-4-hydroxy-6-hydroxymethyldihydropteridine diphosphokinase [Bacillales bacterium]|nr:2-amino-4-hydroxy-6-hydroxymethyldihydropteridine diphosphokinase [Bacillales bacterium]